MSMKPTAAFAMVALACAVVLLLIPSEAHRAGPGLHEGRESPAGVAEEGVPAPDSLGFDRADHRATDRTPEALRRAPLPDPPQSGPVAAMLDAVCSGDVAALRPLYAPSVQGKITEKGWGEYAQAVSALVHDRYGDDFDESSVNYAFEGDRDRGRVRLYMGAEAVGSMRVVRLGGAWLLDEW